VSHDYEFFLWTLGLASEVLVEMNITSFAWRGTHGIRLRAIDSYNRAWPCHTPASRAGGSWFMPINRIVKCLECQSWSEVDKLPSGPLFNNGASEWTIRFGQLSFI